MIFKRTITGGLRIEADTKHGKAHAEWDASGQLISQSCEVRGSDTTCVHRGPETGAVECPTCNGTVKLKVFVCSLHGSCTLAKAAEGHRTCVTCGDRAGR